jgi:serralysin
MPPDFALYEPSDLAALDLFTADFVPASGAFPVSAAFLNADARDTSITDTGKPSYTLSEAAYQIIRGEPGWSPALGVSATVTYAYRASAPADMPDDIAGFSRFNSAQIDQAELALRAWSDVANVRFVRVGSGSAGDQAYSDSATILMGNYSSGMDGASAFSFYPG